MYCEQCGAEVEKDARFCTTCGKRLGEGDVSRVGNGGITPEAAHEVFEAMPEANSRRLARLDESWAIEARLGLPVRPSGAFTAR